MKPRKRSFPEDFKFDGTSSSTDALCRAVKRLHTHSPYASSCTTNSKEVSANDIDQEVCSSLSIGPNMQLPYPELSRLGISEMPEMEAAAGGRSHGGDGEHSFVGRPNIMINSREQLHQGLAASNAPQDTQNGFSQTSSGSGQASHADGDMAHMLHLPPASLSKLQRGLSHIAISGSASDVIDLVPPPTTPRRDETMSPGVKKGYRLGTRQESLQSEAYDELYEQANTLLKNLHFEWLHRKSQA